MFIARDDSALAAWAAQNGGASVTLGTFDGVHRGHQRLVSQILALRPAERGIAVACTFDPHPAAVLRPSHTPPLIDSLQERLSRLRQLGLDGTFVQAFDHAAAQECAIDYVERVLVRALHARAVVVGTDFRFGEGRQGDVALLTRLGQQHGFVVHAAQSVLHENAPVSSTRIRKALQQGDVTLAQALLGRAYRVCGVVVHGDARGRTLGFPTANVAPDVACLLPYGVYAARATCQDGAQHAAAVSIGVHPTFTQAAASKIEAYLLDVQNLDLYGQPLQLDVIERLRGEQQFSSVPALVAQMHCDVKAVRKLLS